MGDGYPRVSELVFGKPWAILPEKLAVISELVRMRASGVRLSEDEIKARIGAGPSRRPASKTRNVAVIPVYGAIVPRASLMSDMSGGTSISDLRGAFFDAMADSDISAVVFDVDSPGGSVDLVPEFAAEIRGMRGRKPILASSNTSMASAAYWLAAQADEVTVSPSSLTGSIGVFATHEDVSAADEKDGIKTSLISAGKYKIEGNPFEPLSEDARGHIQTLVDAAYNQFTLDVSRGRRVPVDGVRDGFGEGRVLPASAAVSAGLADRVATLEQTITRAAQLSNGDAQLAAHIDIQLDAQENDTEASRGGSSFADEIDAVLCMADTLVAKGRPLTAAKRERLDLLSERLDVLRAANSDQRLDPQVAAMRARIRVAENRLKR